jgi:hypothetical protein
MPAIEQLLELPSKLAEVATAGTHAVGQEHGCARR